MLLPLAFSHLLRALVLIKINISTLQQNFRKDITVSFVLIQILHDIGPHPNLDHYHTVVFLLARIQLKFDVCGTHVVSILFEDEDPFLIQNISSLLFEGGILDLSVGRIVSLASLCSKSSHPGESLGS